jgi:hypothetical protein
MRNPPLSGVGGGAVGAFAADGSRQKRRQTIRRIQSYRLEISLQTLEAQTGT